MKLKRDHPVGMRSHPKCPCCNCVTSDRSGLYTPGASCLFTVFGGNNETDLLYIYTTDQWKEDNCNLLRDIRNAVLCWYGSVNHVGHAVLHSTYSLHCTTSISEFEDNSGILRFLIRFKRMQYNVSASLKRMRQAHVNEPIQS